MNINDFIEYVKNANDPLYYDRLINLPQFLSPTKEKIEEQINRCRCQDELKDFPIYMLFYITSKFNATSPAEIDLTIKSVLYDNLNKTFDVTEEALRKFRQNIKLNG